METDRPEVDRAVRKPALTGIQVRVLARVASGLLQKQVAAEEYISSAEVARITREVKDRLGAENLVKAALIAYSHGYISLPDPDGIVHPQKNLDRDQAVM